MLAGILIWATLSAGAVLAAEEVAADRAAEQLAGLGLEKGKARALALRWQERAGEEELDPLVRTLRQAAEEGAPVELVADKAVEGLAKRVPPPRLLVVLEDWGRDLARASRLARSLRSEFEPAGMSEHEATLRLSLIHRMRRDEAWIGALKEEARNQKTDLPHFLRVGEALGQLARMGVEDDQLYQLGTLWMQKGLTPGQIGQFVRAIETGDQWMPASQVAKRVVENMHSSSPEEVLKSMEREWAEKEKNEKLDKPMPPGQIRKISSGEAEIEKDNPGKGPEKRSGKGPN